MSDPLTTEERERIDRALSPYREDAEKANLFFGVDVRLLPPRDLWALVLWISNNARDKRRDN